MRPKYRVKLAKFDVRRSYAQPFVLMMPVKVWRGYTVAQVKGCYNYGVLCWASTFTPCAVTLVKKITSLPSIKTNLTFDSIFSKKYADSLRAKISPNKTFPLSNYGPFFDQTVSHGTSHVSVIGPDGDLASLTR